MKDADHAAESWIKCTTIVVDFIQLNFEFLKWKGIKNFFKGLKFLEPVPVSANFENNKGNAENFFWWEATPTDYSNWVCNLPISNNLNS